MRSTMHAMKCIGRVNPQGRLVLPRLGLKKNTTVEVIVLVDDDDATAQEMMHASESSLGFWDNPIDDEVWNRA